MPRQANAAFVFKHPVHLLAFGLGSGLAPKMPGTIGTLAALPLWLAALPYLDKPMQLALVLIAFVAGIGICAKTSDALGVHDHGGIVWDEFVGLWLTLALLPNSFAAVLLGLIFFRVFDILKPWPIRWLDQRVHGGLGIMIDDIIAALPAAGLTWLLLPLI